MARLSHRGEEGGEGPSDPNAMTRNESLFGYSAAALVVAAAIFVLTVTTGKGAPAHPSNQAYPIGALVLGVGALACMRLRNRFMACIVLILGAAAASLPKTPNSLSGVKIIALVVPFAFVLVVSQRQRKAQRALGPTPRARGARTRDGPEARGRRRPAPTRTPARTSGRYTPPKSKRRR